MSDTRKRGTPAFRLTLEERQKAFDETQRILAEMSAANEWPHKTELSKRLNECGLSISIPALSGNVDWAKGLTEMVEQAQVKAFQSGVKPPKGMRCRVVRELDNGPQPKPLQKTLRDTYKKHRFRQLKWKEDKCLNRLVKLRPKAFLPVGAACKFNGGSPVYEWLKLRKGDTEWRRWALVSEKGAELLRERFGQERVA